ncbi:MAG: hypothetical protein M3520_12165 [Actinomycetota bacterium]|nr:hypothetical protein [Actinomycetota bacterium]
MDQVRVLGHRCDNPLCQRVHAEHVVASSYAENRREWAARRELSGSPLGDPRGPDVVRVNLEYSPRFCVRA